MYTYDAFAAEFHELLTRDPNACVNLGVARRLGELPDPSRAGAEADVAATRALLARLATVDRQGLGFDHLLDLDLAELTLSARLQRATYTFNGRTMAAQMPTAGDDISLGIFLLFVADPRPDGERLADITARIEAVPAYIEALLGRLDTPVARWVAMDIEKVEALPELLASVHRRADDIGWADTGRLIAARERAEVAMVDYVARLRAMPTTTQLHVGEETARRIVALRGIDLPLEALHRMAADFLAETRATVEDLRRRLVAKYGADGQPDDRADDQAGGGIGPETSAADLHRFLSQRYRVRIEDGKLEQILDRYERERARILSFIEDRDLFPIPAGQDMKIMRTPAFMAPSIPAGAMMPPPPFREGVRTSLVYLTLAQELMDEHTELGIPGMMIHEGIPGHHLQLARAGMHASVIRRHIDASDHAEGWTTMLEDYMLDQGYMGELTDEARFCGKRDLGRIGARVAIDLFFMTGERGYLDVGVDCDLSPADPFEAAGNLLAAVTGFVPERVQAELNWYSQERAYPLSYLTGNHLVWQLKHDVAAAQRGKLEGLDLDRAFHGAYLEAGNMPVSYLRRVFQHMGLLT